MTGKDLYANQGLIGAIGGILLKMESANDQNGHLHHEIKKTSDLLSSFLLPFIKEPGLVRMIRPFLFKRPFATRDFLFLLKIYYHCGHRFGKYRCLCWVCMPGSVGKLLFVPRSDYRYDCYMPVRFRPMFRHFHFGGCVAHRTRSKRRRPISPLTPF